MLDRPLLETKRRFSSTRDDWLSDEVVVDFPSMAGLVDLICASFFGETGNGSAEIHTTKVKLTAQEAKYGLQLPLDLPVQHSCPVCGGRGEMWSETCGMCSGTGGGLLSHHCQLRVPPGVRHGTCLRYCVTPPFAPETHIELHVAVP